MSDGNRQLTPRQAARRRNPELTVRIGANIRARREEFGFTQAQLARTLDNWTNEAQVSKWETGKHRPNDRNLERLAEVLEVPGATWFYEIHARPSKTAA